MRNLPNRDDQLLAREDEVELQEADLVVLPELDPPREGGRRPLSDATTPSVPEDGSAPLETVKNRCKRDAETRAPLFCRLTRLQRRFPHARLTCLARHVPPAGAARAAAACARRAPASSSLPSNARSLARCSRLAIASRARSELAPARRRSTPRSSCTAAASCAPGVGGASLDRTKRQAEAKEALAPRTQRPRCPRPHPNNKIPWNSRE